MLARFKNQHPAPKRNHPKINFAAHCNCHSTFAGRNCVIKARILKPAPVSAGKGFEKAAPAAGRRPHLRLAMDTFSSDALAFDPYTHNG